MSGARAAPPPSEATGTLDLFGRVLVGVDETPESLVAAAQARVLAGAASHMTVVAVAETYLAAHAGAAAVRAEDDVAADTAAALEQACELAAADEKRLTSGRLVDVLLDECRRGGSTLIAVGGRPHRRLTAVAFGGHDVDLLRNASCAVLLARPGWGPARPARVVVGVDGSEEAHAAEAVARPLAARLGCEIVPVVPLASHPDTALLRAEREDGVLHPGDVVDAVAGTSGENALVVAGRGAHTERIAFAARCSVLVVPAGG